MSEMTSHERFSRMFAHKEADRVPIQDLPWDSTVERWRREGLPEKVDWKEYFGVDRSALIVTDSSPRFEHKIIEETDEYRIETTPWGCTVKNFKHSASTPQFLEHKISTPDAWREAKARMAPSRDRIDWDWLKANYKTMREENYWLYGLLWFGFDAAHSWMVGTETLLLAMRMEPDWCKEMFNHFLDVSLALLEMVWDEGYHFDCIYWPDDMGYKFNQFFSVSMYREMLKPVHKRAIDWAHSKGIKTYLHSCGDIRPFIPELIDIGLDCLNPLEVKAGVDTIEVKKKYGKDLVLHGGDQCVALRRH